MRALTLWQPWASLIALGVKTIETRSWSTSYRGPLAIHAAARRPDTEMLEDGLSGALYDEHGSSEALAEWYENAEEDFIPPAPPRASRWSIGVPPRFLPEPMPLGAVIATCRLINVLPIRSSMSPDASDDYIIVGHRVGVGFIGDYDFGMLHQVPFGDFTPGRFAWLLSNVTPIAEPVATRGHQGLWNWTPEA